MESSIASWLHSTRIGLPNSSSRDQFGLLDSLDFTAQFGTTSSAGGTDSFSTSDVSAPSKQRDEAQHRSEGRAGASETMSDDRSGDEDETQSVDAIHWTIVAAPPAADSNPKDQLGESAVRATSEETRIAAPLFDATETAGNAFDSGALPANKLFDVEQAEPPGPTTMDASIPDAVLGSPINTANGGADSSFTTSEEGLSASTLQRLDVPQPTGDANRSEEGGEGLNAGIEASEATQSTNEASRRVNAVRKNRSQRWFERPTDPSAAESGKADVPEDRSAGPRVNTVSGQLAAGERMDGQFLKTPEQSSMTFGDGHSSPESIHEKAIATPSTSLSSSSSAQLTSSEFASLPNQGGGITEFQPVDSSELRSNSPTHDRLSDASSPKQVGILQSTQAGHSQKGILAADVANADRVRLIQRVARSFSRLGPDGGSVQLRLHPPELGALAMQVKIEGTTMSARMVTESAAAREVILDSLPQLRSRLAEQGYEITQISVDVGNSNVFDGSTGSGLSDSRSDPRQQASPPTDLRRASYLRRQLHSASLSTPANSSILSTGTGVDVVT